MSSNSPGNIPGFALAAEAYQTNNRKETGARPVDTRASSLPNDPVLQFPLFRGQQGKHRMQLVFFLLVVICLGSVGGLSLAPALFPNAVHLILSTHPSFASESASNVVNANSQERGCNAQPADMKYLPISAKGTSNSALPRAWFQAGRSQKDLPYAKACAASFVDAYQTFDANNQRTFETCIYMLTNGGKQRFYGSAPNMAPDEHMLPMWRASMQQQEVRQVAQAGAPKLLGVQYTAKLLVWMLVPYQRSISIAGSQPVVEDVEMTVLLVAIPVNDQETGWQVSQWQNDKALFKPSIVL